MRHPLSAPIALLAVIILAASGAAAAPTTFQLPDEASNLLPAGPACIVAVASLDGMVDDIVAVAGVFGEQEGLSREKLVQGLDESLGGIRDAVDRGRPLAIAFGLPDLMGGGEPPVTLIVPVKSSVSLPDTVHIAAMALARTVDQDGYVALSSMPDYAPAEGTPDLAGHLARGAISASLDLDQVMVNFGPFIEMGLAAIPTRPAGTPPDSTGAMSEAEAHALGELVGKIMDSLDRFDLAMGVENDMVTLTTGIGVTPGSALDPGPQPEFARALALTSALPQDADILQAMAFDQMRLMDTFREYYLVSMRQSMAAFPGDIAEKYAAWGASYLDCVDLWSSPLALAVRTRGDHMAVAAVLEPKDAGDARDRLANLLMGLDDVGLGFTLTPGTDELVAGVPFRTWTVAFDPEKLESTLGIAGMRPVEKGPADIQADQLTAMLQKIMPKLYMGVADGRLVLASDDGTADLEFIVRRLGKGQPPATLAGVVEDAGKGVRQAFSGDLMSVMAWATELVNQMDPDHKLAMERNPIPFRGTTTLEGADLRFRMGVDLASCGQLMQAFEAMEQDGNEDGK